MQLTNGEDTFDFFVGDTFTTKDGKSYMLVSAEGFNLKDYEDKAEYIIVDIKYGSMEGYTDNLDEIWMFYDIDTVIPNHNSKERKKGIKK